MIIRILCEENYTGKNTDIEKQGYVYKRIPVGKIYYGFNF